MNEDKKTRKAPAFQLYTDDFLAGTIEMSQEEVGQFIRLLCHQWNRGSIPVETEKQQRLAGGCVSVDVLAKFDHCDDGLLRNKRLESVRTEKGKFLQSQSAKGKLSAEKRRLEALERQSQSNQNSTAVEPVLQPESQPSGQPEFNSPSPSPNNKEESIAPKSQRSRFVAPSVQEVETACIEIGLPTSEAGKFIDYYESKGWKVNKSQMKSWIASLRNWKRNRDERQQSLPIQSAQKKDVDWRDSI
jgi:uncharacterized protein YdaU (DUF1376 family)